MYTGGRNQKVGCIERISEIMQAVYSLARLDSVYRDFRDDRKLKRSLGLRQCKK